MSPFRPERSRGFIRRPDPEELMELGRREHLALTRDEAERYARILDGVLGQVDRLDELHRERAPLRHLDREPGRPPTPREDPGNAFTWVGRVTGSGEGPLAGLRAAVKDNIAVAGMPVSNGSRLAAYVPTADAVVVERLLDAGADVVGKLNMDDFASGGLGETSVFGAPRNPVDPARSAGGSSGGTGAAVAAGAIDVGLAVDQGGSGRVPAAFCGVVSLKATQGLIPSHGITHMDHTIDSVAPTARSVALTAAITDAIAGHDDRDPQWVRARPGRPRASTRCRRASRACASGWCRRRRTRASASPRSCAAWTPRSRRWRARAPTSCRPPCRSGPTAGRSR